MKITVDGQDVFTLSETQKKVIRNEILDEEFETDMKRRLHYILNHKYEQCFQRLYDEWCKPVNGSSKLEKNGVRSIPTNPDELSELIFSQPNYENRSKRKIREDEEERLKKESIKATS